MRSELTIRFDYGRIVPWVRSAARGRPRVAVAGPDALCFSTPAPTRGEDMRTISEFSVEEGAARPVRAHVVPVARGGPGARSTPSQALEETESYWREWSAECPLELPERQGAAILHRSLIVLKALTYAPTGGIVAAPTTSLPE